MKIKSIIAGNWKMNKKPSESNAFVNNIMNQVNVNENIEIIFSPSFVCLPFIDKSDKYSIASQNCHWEKDGAFTGEISTNMLVDCNVSYVITGHSERRHIFEESNEMVNSKIKACLNNKLKPILCIGETIEDRNKCLTKEVLSTQIFDSLKGVETLNDIVLAYEPVWAIGTGKTASLTQVGETHKDIKEILLSKYDKIEVDSLQILYGGSVSSSNAEELISLADVHGFLIGGASLDVDSFATIINIVTKNS